MIVNKFRKMITRYSILILLSFNFIFFLNKKIHCEELFFTYIGTTLETGLNSIDYNYWDTNSRENKSISGTYYNGGLLLDIFVNNIIGEFSITPQYYKNDSNTTLYNLKFETNGKYNYSLSDFFSLTAGAGLYFEGPPSDKTYKGSGFSSSLGVVYSLDWDWKILFDFKGYYGSFELEEKSSKFSYGAKLGIIRKIGRI